VGQVPDLPLRMPQIARDERSRLAHEKIIGRRRSLRGRKLKVAMAQRGVVFFQDVDDAEASMLVVRDGKAHCIRGTGGRKVLAQPTGVAAIT